MSVPMCTWLDCQAKPSPQLDVPMCEMHAVVVYRSVSSLILSGRNRKKPLATPDRPTTAKRALRDRPGVIYIIRKGDLIKIGYTTSMRQRMSAIRPDQILATTPGTMKDEKALHYRFGQHWVEGEWFRMGADLMAYIAELRSPRQQAVVEVPAGA